MLFPESEECIKLKESGMDMIITVEERMKGKVDKMKSNIFQYVSS